MTRHAWIMTLSVGLLASLVPGCKHSDANNLTPVANQKPTTVRDGSLVAAPPWPIDPAGGEEFQGGPPDTLPPVTERSPYGNPSLLTGLSERTNRKNKSTLPEESLLRSDPPVLLIPGREQELVPGSGPPPPSPPQVEAKKAPPPDEPIVLVLRSLLNDRPQEALEQLKGYDPCNQEALICLTAIVARLAKKRLDQLSPTEVDNLQEQLQKSLLCALRPRAELLIDKMCFCDWIKGYGVYKELPKDYEFQPGTADRPGERAQLYVELRNLTSAPRGNAYETGLHSTMRILDAGGKEVFLREIPEAEGPSRTLTPLPDYYKSYWFYVPHLPPGRYQLRLEVRDVTRPQAPRLAAKSLEFRVAAGMAGS